MAAVHDYSFNGYHYRLLFDWGDSGIIISPDQELTPGYIDGLKHAQAVFEARNHYIYTLEMVGFGNLGSMLSDSSCEWNQSEIDYFNEAHAKHLRDNEIRRITSPTPREKILQRDNYTCQNPYCNVTSLDGSGLEIDHIIPKSRGGSNQRDNLQVLCAPCNQNKAAKTMDEWLVEMSITS